MHPPTKATRNTPAMCEPNFACLPAELKIMVFVDDSLEYYDLFCASCVNKEWRSIILSEDVIRKRMWLPCLDRSKDTVLPQRILDPIAEIHIDHRLPHQMNLKAVILKNDPRQLPHLTAAPWDSVEIHTLFKAFRTYRKRLHGESANKPVDLTVSYQLLRYCKKPHIDRNSATWREMYATKPPLMHLTVILETKVCSTIHGIQIVHTRFPIYNKNGVTLGNIVDVLWYPQLMRNIGLVPNDLQCRGYKSHRDHWNVCRCYHTTNGQEVYYKVQMAIGKGTSVAEARRMIWEGENGNEHGEF